MLQLRCHNTQVVNCFSFFLRVMLEAKEEGPLGGASGPWKRKEALRSVAAAPLVVQTDADDVVGVPEGPAAVNGEDRRADGGGGGSSRKLGLAEIDIKIFELGAPAAAQGRFDAGAGGPSRLDIAEAGDGRCCERGGRKAAVERRAVLDLAVRDTSRPIEQHVGAPQDTQPAARRAEPLNLVIGRHRERNSDGAAHNTVEGRTALLAGGLEVGFEAPHPGAELIVVAGLDTADHAVDVLRLRVRVSFFSRGDGNKP